MKNLKSSNFFKFFALACSLVLFSVSLIVNTFSRYVTKTNAPFEGKDHLDYSVNAVFVVKNQEELFSAINQGYTYLQLDKEIENPLIVTEKAETLHSDLIIDLNGIEIQRNGYEPILNIKPGVRLTVTDTSIEGTGGLYNPVGSVFNIAGGTLTVVDGDFESGPRYSEYYSYNSGVLNSNNESTKRTVVEEDAQDVLMHVKQPDGTFASAVQKTAPIIKSYPEKNGDIEYKHGNIYFDVAVTKGDVTILPDTYCYYRTSEDIALDLSDTSMADWYYTYYVTEAGFDYVGVSASSETDIKITIFGYENTIKRASEISDPKNYYAAIQMQSGVLDVQRGGFFSYFGIDTTACVNAQGGLIDVAIGEFSSRTPNAYDYTENGVNVKEDDSKSFGDGYFDNYNWATSGYDYNGNTYYGNLAHKGESYCILNGGNADVKISTGELYSSNNNIVSMYGGKLEIGGGEFTKRITNGLQTSATANMSAIYMMSGDLDVANAVCNVLGDSTNGIYMLDGVLSVNNTNYNIEGDSSKGIYMLHGKLGINGGTCNIKGSTTYGIYSTVSGAGNFTVTDTSFVLTEGNDQTGIYAENSQIVASTTNGAVIHIEGNNANGIHVSGENSVVDSNAYTYQLHGNYCNGIHMEEGKLTVDVAVYTIVGIEGVGINMDDGELSVTDADYYVSGDLGKGINMLSGKLDVTGGTCRVAGVGTYGIYSTVEGEDNFNVTDTVFNLRNGSEQTGIYAYNGKIKLNKKDVDDAHISISGPNGKGIWVDGGSVDSGDYDYFINGDTSYGIYSTGGAVNVNGGNVLLYSNVSCYGIYAVSTDNSKLDIKLNGVTTDVGYQSENAKDSGSVKSSVGVYMATNNQDNVVQLQNTNVYCYEVGVALSGGKLNVLGTGEIRTKKASAIVVMGGDLTFESQSAYTIESFATTDAQETNVYDITLPVLSGNAITDTAYNNADGLYVSNGSFTSYGGLSLTHTGLRNNISYNNYTGLVITSYAVRVVGGSVFVYKGDITALAGGGIYCSGGNITMGNKTTQNSDITVKANGRITNDQEYHAIISTQGSWQNEKSVTGGNAIELAGGNIVIYSGYYEAQFGNGLAANSSGEIDVHDGEFYGWMNDEDNDMTPNYNNSGVRKSGPSAFYGLKVIGGATVNIYGGIYDGGNGGAFVTGIDKNSITFNNRGPTNLNTTGKKRATVYIYAGTFGGSGKGTLALDGFNVYDYSNVVFGAYTASTSPYQTANQYLNAIMINAQNATIATNPITNSSLRSSSNVYVYYGDYDSGNTGVWNDNANTVFYNTRTSIGYTQTKGGGTVQNNTSATLFDGTL